MSSGFKFELDHEGVGQLLKSEEMQSVLISYASAVQNRAGDDYSVYVGRTRANVSVRADNDNAVQDNYENNTLLKAVRG